MKQTIDGINLFKKHKGKWVGLKANHKTVISSGSTVSEVIEKSREKGFENPELFKVPKKSVFYVGV